MGLFDKVRKAFKSDEKDDKLEKYNEMEETGKTNESEKTADSNLSNEMEEIKPDNLSNVNKTNNFKYLDNLIHSGPKEIFIDSDITLDDDETSQYKDGIKLDIDDLIINGQGHTIDARYKTRIFECLGKNVTIRDMTIMHGTATWGAGILNRNELTIEETTLKENATNRTGGAINNYGGTLTVIRTTFENNTAVRVSGAINNFQGKLTIIESEFKENKAQINAGAIHNHIGNISVTKSTFTANRAEQYGGAINTYLGKCTISQCEFSLNKSGYDGAGVSNTDSELSIRDSIFTSNNARRGAGINNKGDAMVMESTFKNNSASNGGGINQETGYMTVMKSTFIENSASNRGQAVNNHFGFMKLEDVESNGNDIYNYGRMYLVGNLSSDLSRPIVNEGSILLEGTSSSLEGKINNQGQISSARPLEKGQMDFSYLNDMIQSGVKEIRMEHDIILNVSNRENDRFSKGIRIDQDGLVIDGNGHTIDAQSLTRIFEVNGKGIEIKNITLKNGYGNNGGAIENNGQLTIAESMLIENSANNGGAIENKGQLTIVESEFRENLAKTVGYESVGGAVRNNGELEVRNATFIGNHSKYNGGAIGNKGNLTMKDTTLRKNTAICGGAIHNGGGEFSIYNSLICDNHNSSNVELNKYGGIAGFTTAGGGGAIYNEKGKMALFQSTLKDNNTDYTGGAIKNNSNMTIEESSFENNFSKGMGAAIGSYGNTTIKESRFHKNRTEKTGGAICITGGELSIGKSAINENSAKEDGGAIFINKGNLKVIDCEISSNESEESTISNKDTLQVYDTSFRHNRSRNLIFSGEEESNLSVFGGEFRENEIMEAVIFNEGKYSIIDKATFEDNLKVNAGIGDEDKVDDNVGLSDEESNASGDIIAKNIINKTNMTLISPKLEDGERTIVNEGHILIKEASENLESKIEGMGIVENTEIPQESKFDFGYLDRLIHGRGTKEIILKEDISFENYEMDFYEGGIELDIDGLVIDGNGKTIDGAGKSRIFVITADNITLKNIRFKNGKSHSNYDNPLNNNGGALRINHVLKLMIENCEFIANASNDLGGAISNNGELTISESRLSENISDKGGGAIVNTGKLDMIDSTLMSNTSDYGGALTNENGELAISKSIFRDNLGDSGAAAINNKGDMTITESTFENNTAKSWDAGAIYTGYGHARISQSSFTNNISYRHGGALTVYEGELTLSDSTLSNNKAKANGGAISNYRSKMTLMNSIFTGNQATGGAVASNLESNMRIIKSTFTNNHACGMYQAENFLELGDSEFERLYLENLKKLSRNVGGVIKNEKGELNISESTFTDNIADETGGAIWLKKSRYKSENCIFKGNEPNDFDEEKDD